MRRVVTETDIVSSGTLRRSSREIEVLPAPEGEDSTSINPRREISPCSSLFDIRGLLAQPVDRRLEREAGAREVHGRRLRAQRVGLAVKLLGEEVELAPDRAALGE